MKKRPDPHKVIRPKVFAISLTKGRRRLADMPFRSIRGSGETEKRPSIDDFRCYIGT
jgi:hypothetical protein